MFIKIASKNDEIDAIIAIFPRFAAKIIKIFDKNLLKFCVWSGAKESKSCRSRKMLKNEPTLAIGGVDTAEI